MGNCCSNEEEEEYDRYASWTEERQRFIAGASTAERFERVQMVEGAPTDKSWYHGGIREKQAENRINHSGGGKKDGTYLVYDNPRRKYGYILLVHYKRELHKWKINRVKRTNSQGDEKFVYVLGEDGPGVLTHKTVRLLIKYHRGMRGKPIKLENGGKVVLSPDYVYVVGE